MLELHNHVAQLQHQKNNHLQEGGNYQQLDWGNIEPFIHIRQIKQFFLLLSWIQIFVWMGFPKTNIKLEMGKNFFEQKGKN